ncbi:MAG: hypothetical protein RI957_1106 [Verrucomicrobiota bacterium]|jgi:DNA polymerase
MPRPVDIVIDFLREQESRGITHVGLDDSARAFLKQLASRKSTAPAQTAPHTTGKHRDHSPAPSSEPAPKLSWQTHGQTKAERLADLRRQMTDLPRLFPPGQLRATMVFSQGNPDADIAFIGESPSHHDEQQGYPFAGAVGEKFDLILKAMNLSRGEVYLTHLVKFRPATKNQTTNNRAPSHQEIEAFLPALAHEMEIVAPRVIVTLGSLTSTRLCPSATSADQLRGCWHTWNGFALRTTDAPSFLLTAAQQKKRKFWEDMLAVMEKLNLPISEKQQGFFLPK